WAGIEDGCGIVDCPCSGFQRLLDDKKRRIWAGGIEAGVVLIGLVDASDKFFVVRRVEACRVPAACKDANPFFAHHPENALVCAGGIAEHGNFSRQPEFAELLEEA